MPQNPPTLVGSWQTIHQNDGGTFQIPMAPALVADGTIKGVSLYAFGAGGEFRFLSLRVAGTPYRLGETTPWHRSADGWLVARAADIPVPAGALVLAEVEISAGAVIPQVVVSAYL